MNHGGRKKGSLSRIRLDMGEKEWAKYQDLREKKKQQKHNSEWWKSRRKKFKKILVEYKGSACSICGYNRCLAALEFHHHDPSKKKLLVNTGRSISLKTAMREVDKCDLLCSNCHRELHFGVEKDQVAKG